MDTRLQFYTGSYFELQKRAGGPFPHLIKDDIPYNNIDDYLNQIDTDIRRTIFAVDPLQYTKARQLLRSLPKGDLYYSQGIFDGGYFTVFNFLKSLLNLYITEKFPDIAPLKRTNILRWAYMDDDGIMCALGMLFPAIELVPSHCLEEAIIQIAITRDTVNVCTSETTLISHSLLLAADAQLGDTIQQRDIDNMFKTKLNCNRLYKALQFLLNKNCASVNFFYHDLAKAKMADDGYLIDLSMLDRIGNFYNSVDRLNKQVINLINKDYTQAADIIERLIEEFNLIKEDYIQGKKNDAYLSLLNKANAQSILCNSGFYECMAELRDKAQHLKKRGCNQASNVMNQVVSELNKHNSQYLEDKIKLNEFVSGCKAIINEAEKHPELKKHRNIISKIFNKIFIFFQGLLGIRYDEVKTISTHSIFLLNKTRHTIASSIPANSENIAPSIK